MSMHALRVLEFESVRDRLRQRCETPLAAEAALELAPSFDDEVVWMLLEETREAWDFVSKQSPPSLGRVRDLRPSLQRGSKGGVLGGQELFQIGDALAAMRGLRSFLSHQRESVPGLWRHAESIPDLQRLEHLLIESVDPSGALLDAAGTQLASLRQKGRSISARLLERIQSYTSGKGRDLLSDPIYTQRDGRYVVPLKAEHRGRIRGIVHDTSASGQTIYVEPEDVLQLGNQLRENEAAVRAEEQKILAALSAKVGAVEREVGHGIEAASHLDLLFAKARLALDTGGARPERLQVSRIEIQGGRHPLLDPETVVPLDLSVGVEDSVLITGPNTGGKTVAIKTVGLFVLMIQAGLYPPARHVRAGSFRQVWADIGDEQSIQQSLSTFSGHIKNIAEALKSLQRGALVLLDEVGAGTDPAEGAALAQALLLEMHAVGAAILASTHYGELKAFAYNTEGFQNAAMEFDAKTLRPTYRLLMGAPGASQALRIAERYGIPRPVVERAREGLSEEHQNVSGMLEKLDQAQRQARQAQSEADRRSGELRRAEQRAEEKLTEAEEVRRSVHQRATAAVEAALREIRLEAASIFEELKKAGADPAAQERARRRLKDLQEVGGDFAREIAPKPEPVGQPVQVDWTKGMSVRIEGYTQVGTLVDAPRGDNATVQLGILKMTVPVASLRPAEASAVPKPERSRTNIRLQKAQTASSEIHLRAMRAEDASDLLERFLDDAVLGGIPSVRIVHGKGEGILRRVVREVLRKHPDVASFRDGEPSEGGHGVTVAKMR
jgi:DNA mismatch repair protein MutS2